MALKFIDILAGVPSQTLSMTLGDDNLYTLAFNWNTRASVWTLNIVDENDVVLVNGLFLRGGTDILSPFNFGIGKMYSVDLLDSGLEMTLENAGIDVVLIYDDEV